MKRKPTKRRMLVVFAPTVRDEVKLLAQQDADRKKEVTVCH